MWLDLIIYPFCWEPLISCNYLKLILWNTNSKQYNFLYNITVVSSFLSHHEIIHQDDVDDNKVIKRKLLKDILLNSGRTSKHFLRILDQSQMQLNRTDTEVSVWKTLANIKTRWEAYLVPLTNSLNVPNAEEFRAVKQNFASVTP